MTTIIDLYGILMYALLIACCAAGVLLPLIIHLNPAPGNNREAAKPAKRSHVTHHSDLKPQTSDLPTP